MERKTIIKDGKKYYITPMEIYQVTEVPKGATSVSFDFTAPIDSTNSEMLYSQTESELTLNFIRFSNTTTFLRNIGINPHNCWIFHETLTSKLIPNFRHPKPGDIDLIIGNFYADGKTPDFNLVIAMEIKVRKIIDEELKSFPSGQGTTQAKNLVYLGSDQTYLFHFFVQEPLPVKEGYSESWNPIQNSDFNRLSYASAQLVINALKEKGYGYGYVGWGQAYGSDASRLGGISQEILIPAPLKPLSYNTEVSENRVVLINALEKYIAEKYRNEKPLIIKI